MRNRIDEIGFDSIQLFQVGDVVQDDYQANLRDRGSLGAEHSPIIQVDLTLGGVSLVLVKHFQQV